MTMKAPLRKSPLHRVTRELGATTAVHHGWEVATCFSTPEAEAEVIRTGVGLADVSWMGKLEVKGQDSDLQALSITEGEAWHLARGHILITCDPGQEVAISENIAHHIAENEAANAGNAPDSHDESAGTNLDVRPRIEHGAGSEPVEGPSVHGSTGSPRSDYQAHHDNRETPARRHCLHVIDVTSDYTGLLLAGPQSREVLQRLTSPNISDAALTNGSCISARVAGLHTRVLRRDLEMVLACWLFVGTEYAGYAWNTILHAGGQFGIMPVGSDAVHHVRGGSR